MIRPRLATFLSILLMMTASFSTAEPPAPGTHSVTFESTWDGTEQPAELFVPKAAASSGEPLPLLVVLHGRGADQYAWFAATPVRDYAEEAGWIVLSPLARGNYWYRGAGEQDVLDAIDHVSDVLEVDPRRVWLMGHSMGGWGTQWIAARQPHRFAAIVPMSGFPIGEQAASLRHLAPFYLHDETDEVVPVEYFRSTAADLARRGISHRYHETTGYGHASSMIGDTFPQTFPWLEAHPQPEALRRVTHATRTPLKGRAYWLDIAELTAIPKTAAADARLSEDGTSLDIEVSGADALVIHRELMPENGRTGRLELSVNGWRLTSPENGPYLVVRRQGGMWTAESRAELPKRRSPAIETKAGEELNGADVMDVTRRLGAVLLEETGAHAAYLRRDDMQWQGTPVTLDHLLNLYCYAIEDLVIAEMSARKLRAAVEEDEYNFIAVYANPDAEKSADARILRVLMAADRAREIGVDGTPLPWRPDELFLRHAERVGRFL